MDDDKPAPPDEGGDAIESPDEEGILFFHGFMDRYQTDWELHQRLHER